MRRLCWISALVVGLVIWGCRPAGGHSPGSGALRPEGVMDSAALDSVASTSGELPPENAVVAMVDSPRKPFRTVEDSAVWERRKRATSGVLEPPIRTYQTIEKKRKMGDCNLLLDRIKKGWSWDGKQGLYRCSPKDDLLEAMVEHQQCFYDLLQGEMERFLGKPSARGWKKSLYYLTGPCLDDAGANAPGCEYLVCQYEGDSSMMKVTRVGYVDQTR